MQNELHNLKEKRKGKNSTKILDCLQAKDAASDFLAFIKAFLRVRILLLALEKSHIFL